MAIFRYESRHAGPTRAQRERYMSGECEEHAFGPDGEILLIAYDEAVYLKNDIEDVRILFTGAKGKEDAYEEVQKLVSVYGRGGQDREEDS